MKPVRKDSLETRRQLIDAAEKLFAERGIENVNLLEIGREAGQKNRNAPQYHFGDKASLVHAVLDKHTDLIAQRRRNLLDELNSGKSPNVAELVRVFVLPVAEHVANAESSQAFLLINAQLMTSSPLKALGKKRAQKMPEVKEMSRLFDAVLPKESPSRRYGKMLLMRSMLYHGLASFYAQGVGEAPSNFLEILCTGIEAVLTDASGRGR